MGFITGFRTCLIEEPGSDGLKGASAPYGRGIGSSALSSGMYALGRGSAVVYTSPAILYCSWRAST